MSHSELFADGLFQRPIPLQTNHAMNLQSTTILLMLLCLSGTATAQILWLEGDVTLITGVKIRGEIDYQPQADLLLIRTPDKVRTYTADQLRQFHYIDLSTSHFRTFSSYEITQPTGETRSVIFEELIPNGLVPLLQLPASHGAYWAAKHGLAKPQKILWQTAQLWYIYLDGRFVAPDVFVETELDELVAAAPEAVQQWAEHVPRPTDPSTLAKWLACFSGRVDQAQRQLSSNPKIANRPYAY